MNTESQSSPETASLDSLNFLLGRWEAVSRPEEPAGGFEFALQLQSKIIVRTNHADYAAADERPAFRHEDLMVIYLDPEQGLRADYYDSEGHVIRYGGRVTGKNQVVFSLSPTAASPGFRLGYSLDPDGRLNGSFEVAQPDRPDSFAPYLAWSAIKTAENDS